MQITEKFVSLPIPPSAPNFLDQIREAQRFRLGSDLASVRFAVTNSDAQGCDCEVGVIEGAEPGTNVASILDFRKREWASADEFNAVFVVPTGVGAEIGGHAGDATPVARMLAEICDNLITHPNVVNASDLNEMTENTVYVEGSILSRLLMGTVGLRKVRSNRVLTIVDEHEDELFVNSVINAVSAARASFGLNCTKVVRMESPVRLTAQYSSSGRAAGKVENFGAIIDVLDAERPFYDAVAIASVINVPEHYHQKYFNSAGEMVNPWGGVEALLTHSISSIFDVPAAHSPMLENRKIANADVGIVEPRLAAEAVSMAFLHCVLKGLHRSPVIVTEDHQILDPSSISVEQVSCLVIPQGCLGLPTLAALQQGIPVIAVNENRNLMKNDLRALPWADHQYFEVKSYMEAAGLMCAMRAGVDPASTRRPLASTAIERIANSRSNDYRGGGIKSG